MRPAAARAHPSLHAEPPARRDRAGDARRTSCASSSTGSTSRARTRCSGVEGLAAVDRAARRLRARGGRAGSTTCCPRASPTMAPSSSTGSASAAAWRGAASRRAAKAPLRTSPIALLLREHAEHLEARRPSRRHRVSRLGGRRRCAKRCEKRGASFFHELVDGDAACCPPSSSAGSPSWPARASRRPTASPACARCSRRQDKRRNAASRPPGAGSLLRPRRAMTSKRSRARCSSATASCSARCCSASRSLPPWRELVRVYRRLEARGEIRGGRFVAGFGGEQFAARGRGGPAARGAQAEKIGELVVLSAADPLNLVGILTPEARVPAIAPQPPALPRRPADRGAGRRRGPAPRRDRARATTSCSTLLARRSLRHPLRPHLRMPTAREAAILARKKPLSESEHAASLRARH